jgi:uncharacterized OsmC-like protein
MKSEELRKIQTPLKSQYKIQPDSALKTLKAVGKIGEDISCIIETKYGVIEAGLHPASGGTGYQACSGDMLLEALVACTGVTLGAVATAFGIDISESKVEAEGDLDFRGTLGVSQDVPVGFKSIRLKFFIKSNASDEKIKNLINLTEKYCVIYQTLKSGASIETEVKINK